MGSTTMILLDTNSSEITLTKTPGIDVLGATVNGRWISAYISSDGRIHVPMSSHSEASMVRVFWRQEIHGTVAEPGQFTAPLPSGSDRPVRICIGLPDGWSVSTNSAGVDLATPSAFLHSSIAASIEGILNQIEQVDRSRESERATLLALVLDAQLQLRHTECIEQLTSKGPSPSAAVVEHEKRQTVELRAQLEEALQLSGFEDILNEARTHVGLRGQDEVLQVVEQHLPSDVPRIPILGRAIYLVGQVSDEPIELLIKPASSLSATQPLHIETLWLSSLLFGTLALVCAKYKVPAYALILTVTGALLMASFGWWSFLVPSFSALLGWWRSGRRSPLPFPPELSS